MSNSILGENNENISKCCLLKCLLNILNVNTKKKYFMRVMMAILLQSNSEGQD